MTKRVTVGTVEVKAGRTMRIGLLTGGGDAPGLNGILESVSRTLLQDGHELVGILDGFEGIFFGKTRPIHEQDVMGVHCNAGTFLGTTNKMGTEGREKEFLEKLNKLKLDGLVVAGGDGTFKGLQAFAGQVNIIGVPKTIDNDLSGTEITFGYDTACSVVAEAIDSLRATADAHRRIIFVETMGREAGWIALGGGLASYADAILIPERPFGREDFIQFVEKQKKKARRGLLVSVSEGAVPRGEDPVVAFRVEGSPQADRYGGIAQGMARWTESRTGWEARHVVLGHLQRAQHPTTTDRFLTLSMGVEVARMVEAKAWGQAVVYREGRVRRAPIQDLMGPPRTVDPDHRWVRMAQALGIFI